jgi:hypothetical protein
MNHDSQLTTRPPRLNPFAFPSDTDFRFVLLIVSVLGASLFLYNWLYFSIPVARKYWTDNFIRCSPLRSDISPSNFIANLSPEAVAARTAFEQCRAPAELTVAIVMIGGVSLLLIAGVLIYWTFPARKIWRDRLIPLAAEDAPEVVAYLAELCQVAGLPRPPIFVWNPLNPGLGGQAFGHFGRYYVALNGGLVTQFYTDRLHFRAVLLHELAHLRNADVDKTYLAVAVWQAFLLAALLPFLTLQLLTLPRIDWEFLLNIAWRTPALAVLVLLMRNAVLRSRELYADVRASIWDGPGGSLNQALASLPNPKSGCRHITWRVHPTPDSRRHVLTDLDRLFPLGFWDAFGAGAVGSIALPNVMMLLTLIVTGLGLTSWIGLAPLASGLIFAPLVVGVVGLGMWRGTFAALARGRIPHGATRLGLGLGLGIALGEILSFGADTGTLTTSFLDFLFGTVFNIIFLLIGMILLLNWVAASASSWLEVAMTRRSLRLIYTIDLLIATGVLAVWLGWFFFIRSISPFLFVLLSLGTVLFISLNPLTSLLLISLWSFPLAAWFWHRRVASVASHSWAFLDEPPLPLASTLQAPFRPFLAISIGLFAGLLFCGLLLIVRIGLRLALPETTRGTEEFLLWFYYAYVALAILMQAATAAVVAAWTRRLAIWHGLFAAFVSGCVMAIGVLGSNLLFGGTITGQFAWVTFSQIVNPGALLSLPIAWGAAALAGIVRSVVSDVKRPQPSPIPVVETAS